MASKKSRKVISVEMKQEIIRRSECGVKQCDLVKEFGLSRRSECGVKQCDLVKEFGLSKTTIFTILTNKDAIKSAKVAKGVSKLFHEKHRSSIHEEMERLLAIWIKDRQVKGDVTTQDIICHKAKKIYDDLKKNVPGSSSNQDNEEEFKASRGWFFRFKKRTISNLLNKTVEVELDEDITPNDLVKQNHVEVELDEDITPNDLVEANILSPLYESQDISPRDSINSQGFDTDRLSSRCSTPSTTSTIKTAKSNAQSMLSAKRKRNVDEKVSSALDTIAKNLADTGTNEYVHSFCEHMEQEMLKMPEEIMENFKDDIMELLIKTRKQIRAQQK
ncbi:Tc5 transposase DNA-binding domain [Popillia japonica]|uniref:Tc5 transposase DNA-binding domain n=1 Tax=Popillia japonica TaxID=7064 RepID=A0AAW1L4I2_POPJA